MANTHIPGYDQDKQKARVKVGAVLTFPEGVTRAQVCEFLDLWRRGLGKNSIFGYDSVTVEEYDPKWGSPVFYCP